MSIDPSAFRQALARFASGVTILTTRDASGRDAGMTVSAFSSLSLDPPLILACVDRAASAAPALAQAERFVVNVLAADQEPLSRRFAVKDIDRFEGVAISRGLGDIALLDGALAHLECRVTARHPGGDHTIYVGHVDASAVRDGEPLLYFRGRYGRITP